MSTFFNPIFRLLPLLIAVASPLQAQLFLHDINLPTQRAFGADSDGDGVDDSLDCLPANPDFWAIPGEAINLRVSEEQGLTLRWSPPAARGGRVGPFYDVLRAATPSGFAAAACLDDEQFEASFVQTAADPFAGQSSFYLVRAKNPCGGSLGAASDGTPVQSASCAGFNPLIEFCNGFDDDQDGLVDETFTSLGRPCSTGSGNCFRTGVMVCSPGGISTMCNAPNGAIAAVDESCNGFDDDCDGQTDERIPAIGAQCFNGGQHDCIGVVDEMSQAGLFWIDRYEASRVDATPDDAGVSAIRSCSQPGVLPWTGITRDEAAMQCAQRHDSAGAPMRLCDEGEWQAACKPVTDARPFWSMQPNPSAYDPFICNGAERALGAAWPGGTGSDCYALDAGGPVYDLSGNVAEWTATAATAQDYYAGGGHYQSGAPEMSCGIALVVPAGSRSPGLGFRCCADHGP